MREPTPTELEDVTIVDMHRRLSGVEAANTVHCARCLRVIGVHPNGAQPLGVHFTNCTFRFEDVLCDDCEPREE